MSLENQFKSVFIFKFFIKNYILKLQIDFYDKKVKKLN